MAQVGDLQYQVRCAACGKLFLVDETDDLVPKHPPKGVRIKLYESYTPCDGSGMKGRPINVQVKRTSKP